MPDAKPEVKGGKKLPKWVLPVGAVAVVGSVLYLKKKKAQEPEAAPTSSEPEALNRQSFIPVTGENVAGVGAGSGGGFSGGGSENNSDLIKEILTTDRESQHLQSEQNQELLRQIISNLGTGGGAPTSQGPGGVVTAPPPSGGTPPGPVAPAPPPPSPKAASCPSSFPHLNGSTPSEHTCYKDITCGNGCAGHKYQDGHSDCQTKTGGKCHW